MLAVLMGAAGLLITAITKDPPPEKEPITEVPVTIKTATSEGKAPQVNESTDERTASRLNAINTAIELGYVIETDLQTPNNEAPTMDAITTPAESPVEQIEPQQPRSEQIAANQPSPEPAPAPVSTPPATAPVTPPASAPVVAPMPAPTPVASTPPSTAPMPAPTPIRDTIAAASITPPAPQPPAPIVVPNAPINLTPAATSAESELPSMPEQPVIAGTPPAAPEPLPTQASAQQPDPNIVAFLEASRITGIKVAGSKSRVLMNNQVFKVGSIVEAASQLQITAIQNNEIQFVDESGVEYRKQFQR